MSDLVRKFKEGFSHDAAQFERDAMYFVFVVSCLSQIYLSPVVRKPVFGVSDQVRHKPGCTATEDG